MSLFGVVAAAQPGAQGFDATTMLNSHAAATFRQAGFTFCIRYLSRALGQQHGDLTAAEADLILDAGLALMAVQHVDQEGWRPSADLGSSNGNHAAANAGEVGFPVGVNIWLDLEGVHHLVSAEDVIAYCNAWQAEVAAGFMPGIYVGANATLNGDQLYWRLKMKHYWKSGSNVPDIPHRGYQMVQRIVPGDTMAGIEIDRDVTSTDAFGGTAVWLTRPSPGVPMV
jgi:hypothetical protein